MEEYLRWGNYDPAEGYSPGAAAPKLRRIETTVTPEERMAFRESSSRSMTSLSGEASAARSEPSIPANNLRRFSIEE